MKKRNGLTLIELLLTLAFIGIIIAIGTNIFLFGSKAQSLALEEFDIQSNTRLISEYINNTTRFATKTHTIPRSSFQYSEDGVRDSATSYIGVTKNGHVVIDEPGENLGDPRRVKYLAKKQAGINYEIVFEKSYDNDGNEIPNVLHFKIKGIKNGKEVTEIVSDIEVLNSLQIEHLGTTNDPAVAIAFTKMDPGSQQWIKVSPDAYIVMVLDKSGSMKWDMNGNDNGITPASRISILKDKAKNMINRLSELDFNIYVSIVPFSDNANSPGNFINIKDNKQAAIDAINNLNPNGATNTGDGIRRGYYQLKNKGEDLIADGKDYSKFTQHMMVLVDGETNLETVKTTERGGSWLFGYYAKKGTYVKSNEEVKTSIAVGNINSRTVSENDNSYITHLGNELVKKHTFTFEGETKQLIDTFVIGFSNKSKDHGSLQAIGEALNGKKFQHGSELKPYIIATNADDLDFAFEEFEAEVENNLYLITRPQLWP